MEEGNPPSAVPAWMMWEALGSIAWFLMDGCWMWTWQRGAYLLVVPAVGCHLLVLWHSRSSRPELLVGLATAGWLSMNITWMVSDFAKAPGLLTAAKVSFAVGVAFLLVSFVVRPGAQEVLATTLSRFRRLRLD